MFSNPNLFDAPRQSTKQPSFSNQSTLFDQNRSFTQTSGNNRDTSYLEDNNNNFKVIVRVRPALPRELESGQITSTIQVNNDNKRVTLYEYYNIDAVDPSNPSEYLENTNMYTTHNFTFDTVYPQNSTQGEVYEGTAKPAVMSVLQGYNATILAYGQTGTGKTYSMEGFNFDSQDSQKGIIPRSMEEIFKYIENVSNSRTTFMVRVSYLQIYNEVVSDLLRTDRSNLQIREDKKKGVFVEGLSEWAVRSPNEIYSLIQKGALSRATAATKMNDVSSRSHAVFIIIVEQMVTSQDEDTGEELKEIRVGKLNLVDLAGSERVRVTGATGKRLEESKKINQSLSALGNVISALADQKQSKTHIPYRDSKITRLLEDSLGGNCITTMMAMVSPIFDSFSESLSTLKFANRAKNIKNAPIINEDVDQKALLRKYEAELKKLRAELENKNKMHHDKKNVSQLEEDKRRAERDKLAAFEALEAQSKEFIHEREEKKKLEEKIGAMFSQMLVGGKKIEETPQFRNAVEQQQKIIRQQYDQKLQDLEKERQMIEEDKAQVDRYKQLLLKQRDIMIALTTRLNERDETIVQLQEELDEYDRVHRDTEEQLQVRDKRVFELATALKENNIPLPSDYKEETEITGPVLSHLSDTNTNNMAANNVNQCEVVESLQMQSDAKTAQLVVSLESQLSIALERARKAEEEQIKLREKLAHKDELLKSVQQQANANASTTAKTDRVMSVHKEIKANVDYIIESLSSQNEPQRLQDIARDLLNLQKLVNSAVIVTNSESSSPRDSPSKTASRSGRTIQPVEVKSAGIPPPKGLDTTISERMSEGKEHPRSVSVTPLNNEEPVEQRNSATRHAPSRSTSGEMPKINQVQLKEQSENVVKSQTVQPSPLRGAAKLGADGKAPENKRTISTGIFGKYMGNLVNLDPERKPMTVEDLAKAKKDQPVKKKV